MASRLTPTPLPNRVRARNPHPRWWSQAIAILDVLLFDSLVQEAATPPDSPENSDASSSTTVLGADESCSTPSGKKQQEQQIKKMEKKKSFLRTALVVVPKNVIGNWGDELTKVQHMYSRDFPPLSSSPSGGIVLFLFVI